MRKVRNEKIALDMKQLRRMLKEARSGNDIVTRDIDYANDDLDASASARQIERTLTRDLASYGYKGIKVTCISTNGPGGGWPVVTLTGKRSVVDAALEELWGLTEEDIADMYDDEPAPPPVKTSPRRRAPAKREEMAEIEIDYANDELDEPTKREIERSLKYDLSSNGFKNISSRVITMNGPGGGWPLVSLSGKKSDIEEALRVIWGLDDEDIEMYFE